MNFCRTLLLLLFFTLCVNTYAQVGKATQTVRGVVVDKISQTPLPGAVVLLVDTDPLIGESTDERGHFKLTNVEVGKHSLKVIFLGYKDAVMNDLSVNAGKELVLTVQLEEDIKSMNEVVVTAKVEKNKPLNAMSVVSARTFSVEETQKYAAAFNDPLRMATSFAGVVSSGGDGNNFISVRGNSPNGLLWRMEGVEIPNPNHFSSVGTSGGGVSILSAQVLGNSDFSTGAFAAEYGNALSGVFDLKLRKGNNQKREMTIEAGFLGLNLAAEGPFSKNYEGSYLINYRYSTLSMLSKIGVPLGDAVTDFQDLSLNISLPTEKYGNFGIFGFGGLSFQDTDAEKDSVKWAEDPWYQYSDNFKSNTGVLGVTNSKLFKNNSYLKTAFVVSGTMNSDDLSKMQNDYATLESEAYNKFNQSKITFSTNYTHKLSARSSVRSGFILNQLGYDFIQKDKIDTTVMVTRISNSGSTQSAQLFCQWNYRVNEKITTNVGMHYFQLFLNNSNSIEPRASVKYDVTPKQNISFGYGLHSQLQPLGTYFAEKTLANGTVITPNDDIELTKSHHFVLGYDRNINEYTHIKTELYYQYLYNVPVSSDPTDLYSTLNSFAGYYTDDLNNSGYGRNYGVEITFERFMHNNFYYLITGSLYDSKYRASDRKWYNTMYNTNYTSTVTLGKEWDISNEKKDRVFGVNLKAMYIGGNRYTPIDLDASVVSGEEEYDYSRNFELKNPDYFRLDIGVSLKRNYKKLTTTLALDIQNVTNRENVGGQYFNEATGTVKYWYQAPVIPILRYKMEF